MEKVRPWCGQPSDLGRLKIKTEPQQHGAQQQMRAVVFPPQKVEQTCLMRSVCTFCFAGRTRKEQT